MSKKRTVLDDVVSVSNQAFYIAEEEEKTEELIKTSVLIALSFIFLPIGLNFIVAKKMSKKLDWLVDQTQIEDS